MRYLRPIYSPLLICFMFLQSIEGTAQFVPIQDSSFASFLCQLKPSVTSFDCKMLDTVAASNSEADLYLNNRGIKKADEIVYFKNARLINIQRNGLTSLPNLSSLRYDLEVLDVSYNNLMKLVGVEKLRSLRALNASHNQLKSFPELTDLSYLKSVDLSYNKLSFKDFIPLTRASNFSMVYSLMPQNNLTADTTIDLEEYSSFTLNIPIDEGVPTIFYSWLKNGMPLVNEFRSSLRFSKVTAKDTGVYVLYVTSSNSKLAYVGVNSGPVRIRLKPCQQVLRYELVPKVDCEGSTATLTSLSLSNENFDFESFLENGLTGLKIKLQKQQPVALEEGSYHFVVTDGKNCTVKKENALKIYIPSGSCPIVFTPNGDGFQDELFLDGTGDVSILNKEGRNIKTLRLPCYWDGSDNTGNSVPLGSYLLLRKDGTQEKITVLR